MRRFSKNINNGVSGVKATQVVLAGIGGYGEIYIREMLKDANPDAKLAGIVDPYAGNSPFIGEIHQKGIPLFKTMDEFYAQGRADLAVVSSPIHTHYSYISSCLNKGTSVLCEKPAWVNLKELDDLIEKEKQSGLFVAVGYQLCFSRDVLELKKDIQAGLFGKPLSMKSIRLMRRGTNYYRRNNWAAKKEYQGALILDSPLSNACGHQMQNMLFLLSDNMETSAGVDSVQAELWKARPDIENYDAAAMRVKAAGGTDLLFYTAHCVPTPKTGPFSEFYFEDAVIRSGTNPGDEFAAYFKNGKIKSYPTDTEGRKLRKLFDSIDAVRSGRRPVCTLETSKPHIECVNMVQRFPVTELPADRVSRAADESGDEYYFIPGLEEAFSSCYEKGVLPSEAGIEF